ncbi:MAG TPA: heme biosynthesis HemY N-terminal domain-containing protein [Burkholderiales bacterium]
MRTLLWVILIAALAVGLTLAVTYNVGTVLLVLPPYRTEISLNFALVLLVAAFAAGYTLLRAVSAVLGLPRQVREYRAARRREKARQSMLEALQEYFAGRYRRAEQAAAAVQDLPGFPGLAALLAARATHELRDTERRDAYLAQAAAASPDAPARIVTEAEQLLQERRHQEALELLRRLPRRHTAALRLELRAQQLARNWGEVLALTEELRKRGAFDATRADQLRRHALAENLKRNAVDTRALEQAWDKVPSADRAERRVALASVRSFIALGGCDRAHRIIEQALAANWDSELVGLYAECEGVDTIRRIERAEEWLKTHPADAALLLTLGRLCGGQGLWGKAQSYLEASVAIEPTHSAHLALARLQEQLGNAEAARRHDREGLRLALAQLNAVTGGRRRAPL